MTTVPTPTDQEVLPGFTLLWRDDGCQLSLRGLIDSHTLEQVDDLLQHRLQQLRRLTVDARAADLTRTALIRLMVTLRRLPGPNSRVELLGFTEHAVQAVAES